MECNVTLAQVNTWFNNARSRRGDTNPKLAQRLIEQSSRSSPTTITAIIIGWT